VTAALRIGLVGTGWVAHQHAAGYRAVAADELVVTAVCDPRDAVAADFAERWRVPGVFRSVGDVIASGTVDALAVLTPPAIRDEILLPAMEAGIHLLVEKPFAPTARDAARYVDAADRAGVTLSVSQNFRWFPEYRWLADRLRRPDAGRVEYLEARSFQDRPQQPGVWRAEETRLEMAIYSVHLIDRLQWLAPGDPVTVSAVTRPGHSAEVPGEQFSALTVEFDDGAVARMTSSWKSLRLPVQEARVDTDAGSALVTREQPMAGPSRGVAQFGDEPDSAAFEDDPDASDMIRSYGGSGLEFARAVAEGRDSEHSGRDNLRTMGIMDAAYLSAARGGAPVDLRAVG
jgi:D-apiose dehydrogenase